MRQPLTPNSFAALATACLLAVLAVALAMARPDPAYLLQAFTEEHVRMLGMYDNRAQQGAYRILLALCGVLALGVYVLRPFRLAWHEPQWLGRGRTVGERYGGAIVAVVLLALVFVQRVKQPALMFDLQGRYVLGVAASARVQGLAMLAGLLVAWAGIAHASRGIMFRRRALTATIAAAAFYALVLCACGLWIVPDFRGFNAELLTGVQWHYSGSVASADRLAAGQRLGEIPIHSGLLPSVLLGYTQAVAGTLDLGGHIRFIAALQTVFIALAAAAYWTWYRERPAAFVLAFLATLPWVQPLHAAVLYPNQSAWRFLGLAFGVLVLVALHARQPRRIAFGLGCAAAIAVLWNLETGIGVIAAYVGFLLVRTSGDTIRSRAAVALAFAGGVAAALGLFAVFVRLGLGYWIDPYRLAASFPLLGEFSRGYAGLKLARIDPLPAIIFVHALYIFVRDLVRWGTGDALDARGACRMALAGLVLAWGSYYFKGPHPWNLWSYVFLYGFLLGSLLPSRSKPPAPAGSAWRSLVASPRIVVLAMVVVPAIVLSNLAPLKSLGLVARAGSCTDGQRLSGVCMPPPLAAALTAKAAALRELALREPLLYLTADSYLVPALSGVPQRLTQRDAFAETIRKDDFDRLAADIVALRPRSVLFDDPQALTHGYDFHRQFYARLRTAISSAYERAATQGGWEIWRVKGDAARAQ